MNAATHPRLAGRLVQPRLQRSIVRARRRTARVHFFRRALLMGILLVAGGLGAFVAVSTFSARSTLDEAANAAFERMVNPRFSGRDEAGTPFNITADAALRSADDMARTLLENPVIQFLGDGDPLQTILSRSGVYDRQERRLTMSGSVEFTTDEGYRFTSDEAELFVDQNRIAGNARITGSGPMGSISAGGFEILDNGDRLRFTNGVTARIQQAYRNDPPTGDR